MAEQPQINWNISIEQANAVLACLGKEPFDKVADLVMDLRSQAARQVQAWQAQQQGQSSLANQAMPKPNGAEQRPAA